MRDRRLHALALLALGILGIAAVRDLVRIGDALPWKQLYDFADFYCAGAALDQRADPYDYEPLHRCEHAVNRSDAYRRDPRRVVPAPLPPYDFPPFMLAARLRFPAARTIDAAAIIAAVVAAACGLSLLAIPLDLAALALALPAGYLLLAAGQVVPFALVALVFCGLALARRRDGIAGLLAAATLIEPHLGLPVCVALLVWAPRARISLLASGLALTGIAALTVGPAGIFEYAMRVIPAQAAAETGYVYQYGFTYLLHAFGVPASPALLLGDLSYGAMLLLAVWLSRRLTATLGHRELLAFLPAAGSLIGGPYVHMVDLALAVPAALVLATNLQGRSRNLAAIALVLLAVPWIDVWITKKLFLATLFVVGAMLLRLRVGAAISAGTFAVVAVVIYLFELWPPAALAATTVESFAPNDLAQEAWGAYVSRLGNANALWLAIKVPTWLALGGVLAASLTALKNHGTRPRA